MSNRIQIRRGPSRPKQGDLNPYELGFDIIHEKLYIGLEDGSNIEIANPPKTTLLKSKDKADDLRILKVYCDGLIPGRPYTLLLYTLQRSRRNASRYWRHPLNEIPNGDIIKNRGKFTGYANLANSDVNGKVFRDIPEWMENGGVLRTEWQFVPVEDHHVVEINLSLWLRDLLKHREGESQEWVMIGLPNRQQDKSSRLFTFRVRDDITQQIGTNTNFMALSDVTMNRGEGETFPKIGYFSIKN